MPSQIPPPPPSPRQSNPRTLPNELIFHIIDTFIPEDNKAIAISASHPITKTFWSLALTARFLYPKAMRLLFERCLYVDSFARLSSLQKALDRSGSVVEGVERFRDLAGVEVEGFATSLYLGPFPNDHIDSVSQVEEVSGLLRIMSPYLKRLILSIPQISLISGYDHDCEIHEEYLYDALHALKSLEVFCNVQEDLSMHREFGIDRSLEEIHWANWPNLRVLSLAMTFLSDFHLKWAGGESRSLERWVLVSVDGWGYFNFKYCFDKGRAERRPGFQGKMELLRVEPEGDDMSYQGMNTPTTDEDVLTIKTIEAPNCSPDHTGTSHKKCCEWVKERFLAGDERFIG